MKNLIYACFVISLVAGFIFGQTPKHSDKDKTPDAPPASTITEADLTIAEIAEGRRLLLDEPREAQRLAQLAQKVINNPAVDADARLLAYEMRELQQKRADELTAQQNKYVARVQERTGCKGCELFNFDQKKIFLKDSAQK